MSCQLVGGYQLPSCIFSQAGVQRLYIANFSASTFLNSISDDGINPYSASTIVQNTGSTITSFGANSASTLFYAFDLIQETGSFDQKVVTNIQNGSQYYEGTIDLVIRQDNTLLRNQLKAMAASPMNIIVEDRQGNLYFCGATIGCWNSGGSDSTGKKSDDARGWTLNFQFKEPYPAYFVSNLNIMTTSY